MFSYSCTGSSRVPFFFLMIRRPPRSTLFPTRRSSDLDVDDGQRERRRLDEAARGVADHRVGRGQHGQVQVVAEVAHERSEEHTSELQSQSNLVCRLLLEKKKCTWVCPTAPERCVPPHR